MPRNGTYYVGRIIKRGLLNTEKIIEAMLRPASFAGNIHKWTIIDAEKFQFDELCVIGKLVKYDPQGEVSRVDNNQHTAKRLLQPDMIVAESPFIYIPSYSGIAFLHVWNKIEQSVFIKRFCSIVCESHNNFFVGCDIELISALETFATSISSMSSIYKVSAKVHPPNPLFGKCWEDLKDYLEKRNTDTLNIIEENPSNKAINSDLKKYVDSLINSNQSPFINIQKIDITDAAILMAADGYGKARIEGKQGDNIIVCRTTDNVKNFKISRTPSPKTFYKTAKKIFEQISKERYMEH